MEPYDVLILGTGPAGGTAAIYAARANLKTALISGPMPGGQLTTTSTVENFPGFPDGIQGPQFAQLVEGQARRFGAEFLLDIITRVDLGRLPFKLFSEEKEYHTQSLIISTGSSPRRLGIATERQFAGRGVSYCATCDGRFFQGKTVAVVGGGDGAAEEASHLARLAAKVYLIHRRDRLRAGHAMQRRVLENPKIEVCWNTAVGELRGDEGGLRQALLRDTEDGELREIALDGLFVAIGHVPNSKLFKPWLDLDGQGYIVTDRRTRTKIPGVLAAGDVADPFYRQAITAAGTGCAAAIEAARYLEALEG